MQRKQRRPNIRLPAKGLKGSKDRRVTSILYSRLQESSLAMYLVTPSATTKAWRRAQFSFVNLLVEASRFAFFETQCVWQAFSTQENLTITVALFDKLKWCKCDSETVFAVGECYFCQTFGAAPRHGDNQTFAVLVVTHHRSFAVG